MPVEIRYLDDRTGFEMVGEGTVTGKEICGALNEIYSSELLPRQRCQIWDFTDVESFDFPSNDFTTMVSLDMAASKVNPNIVVAVIGSQDVIYGIARMWEEHMEAKESGFITMVFREREDAEEWINGKLS
jgi:hypothetical protein